MEARIAIRGSGIPRSFVAVCAVLVTMGYGVTAAVVVKDLSAPAAVPQQILQGQGGALQYSGHRGGVQSIDETLQPAYMQLDTRGVQAGPAAVGPDDRPTTTVPWATSIANQFDVSGFVQGAANAPTTQLAPNSFLGPDAQERNSQLAASRRAANPHGYI